MPKLLKQIDNHQKQIKKVSHYYFYIMPWHSFFLLVYVWCYTIDNRNDRIKETRQEYPKQSLYPTIRQPNSFISWHHIRHIIEMASEDFLIRLSVVFKKFGLVFNEFLPVVDCLFHIGIINLSFDSYVFYFADVGFNSFGDSIRFIWGFTQFPDFVNAPPKLKLVFW